MVRWVTLRRSFSLLFSGVYDQFDPEGRSAMVQLLRRLLVTMPATVATGRLGEAARDLESP